MERWQSLKRLLRLTGGLADENWRSIDRSLPVEFVVEDTGTSGDVYVLRHALGRIPRGVVVMNSAVSGAAGPVGWYRDVDDASWSEVELSVRFDVSNAAVRLLVY